MNKPWDTIVDDVQGYLSRGVALLPDVNRRFLEALSEKERTKTLCLVPSCRFEIYHVRLYQKINSRTTIYGELHKRNMNAY
jgi:hypothetical protein